MRHMAWVKEGMRRASAKSRVETLMALTRATPQAPWKGCCQPHKLFSLGRCFPEPEGGSEMAL